MRPDAMAGSNEMPSTSVSGQIHHGREEVGGQDRVVEVQRRLGHLTSGGQAHDEGHVARSAEKRGLAK